MHSFTHLLKSKIPFLIAILVLTGGAMAEYDPDDDVYVRVDDPVLGRLAGAAKVGQAGRDLFDVQEGAHDALKENTGKEVDHYYIHVCVGDECVPIDPVRFSN